LQAIRNTYKHIPTDYLAFLSELGYGSIGNSSYMFYSGPVPPEELFGSAIAETLPDLLLFGDDFSGVSGSFCPSDNWKIVEVDSTNWSITEVAETFEEFLGQFMD
jgi:hypothetical protein